MKGKFGESLVRIGLKNVTFVVMVKAGFSPVKTYLHLVYSFVKSENSTRKKAFRIRFESFTFCFRRIL